MTGLGTRFTGFFHGSSVLFMRQDHRNRLNLTNFQRYLLRLGLNFVKTPTNEGTLYASPKNIDFMLTEHRGEEERWYDSKNGKVKGCFGSSFSEDRG